MTLSPNNPPVIILGMHRSGTTMVAESLRRLGLFLGSQRDRNCESWFFVKANSWILQQARAHWTEPTPCSTMLEDPKLLSLLKAQIEDLVKSPRFHKYKNFDGILGINHRPPTGPWGWKDPRNTFTFPLWKTIFPEARIIHIRRHGADVANSLCSRHHYSLAKTEKRLKRKRSLHKLGFLPKNITNNPRCSNLEGAFSLWEEYMMMAERVIDSYSNKTLDLKYEDVLLSPENSLRKISNFSGLSPSEEELKKVSQSFDASRSFAFCENTNLVEFSKEKKNRLNLFGY